MGKGVGDIYIQASCRILLTKTYSIQDCTEYDTLTSDKNKHTFKTGSGSLTYSSNGLNVAGNTNTDSYTQNSVVLPSEYTLEVDIDFVQSSGWTSAIVCEDMFIAKNGNQGLQFIKISANQIVDSYATSDVTGALKLERTGTQFKVYWKSTLVKTITDISSTNAYGFMTYNNRQATFKNLKIKPL